MSNTCSLIGRNQLQESSNLAQKKKDDKAVKQVAARRKKIDSHMGLEKNEKGHHFRLNRYFF